MKFESSPSPSKTLMRRSSFDSEDGGAPVPGNLAFGYEHDDSDLSTVVDNASETSSTWQPHMEQQTLALVLGKASDKENRADHVVSPGPDDNFVKTERTFEKTYGCKNLPAEHERYPSHLSDASQTLYPLPQHDNRSFSYTLDQNHISQRWTTAREGVFMEPLPAASWRHVNVQTDQYGRQLPYLPSFTSQHHAWQSQMPEQHLRSQYPARAQGMSNFHQVNQAFMLHPEWQEEMNGNRGWYNAQDDYYTHGKR